MSKANLRITTLNHFGFECRNAYHAVPHNAEFRAAISEAAVSGDYEWAIRLLEWRTPYRVTRRLKASLLNLQAASR